jgi:ADP-ribosylation factor GTPase-activating protein 1
MTNYSHKAFENLMKDSNLYCFDCFTPYPLMADLSHGIYLCSNCAIRHKAMGSQMSIIKSITMENWYNLLI